MNTKSTPRPTTLLALAVLTFLAAAQVRADSIVPGTLSLDLGDSLPTYLGVSSSLLGAELCGSPPNGDTKDPKLLAANDGGHSTNALALGVLATTESSDGTEIVVDVTTTGLQLFGPKPLDSDCGQWNYRVILVAYAGQPVTSLTLHRASATDRTGVFTGTVTLTATMEFTEIDTLEVVELPIDLTLALQGPWATASGTGRPPRGGRQAPSPPTSNLALFAVLVDGVFAPLSTPNVQSSSQYGAGGQVVLQASASSLVALNGR